MKDWFERHRTLKNTGPDTLTLKAGTTTLTLNLAELCGDEEAGQAVLTAAGWSADSRGSRRPRMSPGGRGQRSPFP
ncbi:hypothetical protein [Shinella sp. JR1-6]|uniref:hypothetical protein n=1 Tax=unclassified Shinella TaxID=2643062 RepID=UPI00102D4F58|nr:hypothetical protein [Shinella sp. JR1-6]TAA55590.1 hypothetical protein EXZ48_24645 [Shinella sp. JR1-6]